MGEKIDNKWTGSVTHVIGAPIEKIWPILADYGGLHKHFPKIFQKCDLIEGDGTKVGAVRDLAAPKTEDFAIKAKERLVVLDNEKYTFTYSMEESNVGWKNYFAHVTAQSVEKNQTQVKWAFEVDPVPNTTKEEYEADLCQLFHSILTDLMEQVSQW